MSRPTHDRTDLHYGTEDDLVQLLSAAVGSISAGSSLHSALEYIHNEILFFENPPPPGPANQIFFDDFNRVVTRGLGGQWSLNPYDFHGSFTEDIKTSVNGFNVVVPAANFWEAWTGFPLPATGELYFDLRAVVMDESQRSTNVWDRAG
jgi:hypothetical protein